MISYPDSVWDGDSASRNSSEGVQSAPDQRDWNRMIAELAAVQQKVLTDIEEGTGTTNIVTGLRRWEVGDAAAHRTIFILDPITMPIVDAGAAGAHGSIKLYTFKKAHTNIMSGHFALDLTAGTGGVGNSAVLDIGVGTVTTNVADETLATTEQNITTKADVTLTGGKKSTEALQSILQSFDGMTNATELFLNVAVEDASCSADDTLTISGRITVLWYSCNCPT